ncbi:hypothetical protein DPMN_176686 [Dreissena polymorpha]|uniref:Uncharacterized protein n=1 Tax=Dreissena polymorpha TaxID=45954 RepID=A0A9D4E9X3_DREPO|nr:hypothetical protein DPMN_176686 [Dreissena polymorpha]
MTLQQQVNDELLYIHAKSMRNNLVFGNIEEPLQEVNENAESVLREFLVSKLKLANGLVTEMKFHFFILSAFIEWVSRILLRFVLSWRAKFNLFKERELVRRSPSALKDTPYYLHEQFQKEISDKRRKLVPELKRRGKVGRRHGCRMIRLSLTGYPTQKTTTRGTPEMI